LRALCVSYREPLQNCKIRKSVILPADKRNRTPGVELLIACLNPLLAGGLFGFGFCYTLYYLQARCNILGAKMKKIKKHVLCNLFQKESGGLGLNSF